MRSLALALTLALSACIPQSIDHEYGELPLHDSEAPIILEESGSLVPLEQALPSGVLEIGHELAPVTLLIFTEHACAYCKEFHREQLPMLLADYVSTNKIRIRIVPFVLQKYEYSTRRAVETLCASAQGKGLQMHDALFNDLPYDDLELEEERFLNCIEAPESVNLVEMQQQWAAELGVQYVPTFFLNGEKFEGLPYYADLRGRIDDVISRP